MNGRLLLALGAIVAVVMLGPGAALDVVAQDPSGLGGLPQRTPPPRTLEAYWPVFVGLSVAWLGIMVYYLSMSRRVGRISRGISEARGPDPS